MFARAELVRMVGSVGGGHGATPREVCAAHDGWGAAIVGTKHQFVLLCPRYPGGMTKPAVTPETLALRELIDARRDDFKKLLVKYAATSPKLFGSVARGAAHAGSDIDILVEMDPADGNLLMRASGLMEETRALFGRDDIDVLPVQLLKRPIAASVLEGAVAL